MVNLRRQSFDRIMRSPAINNYAISAPEYEVAAMHAKINRQRRPTQRVNTYPNKNFLHPIESDAYLLDTSVVRFDHDYNHGMEFMQAEIGLDGEVEIFEWNLRSLDDILDNNGRCMHVDAVNLFRQLATKYNCPHSIMTRFIYHKSLKLIVYNDPLTVFYSPDGQMVSISFAECGVFTQTASSLDGLIEPLGEAEFEGITEELGLNMDECDHTMMDVTDIPITGMLSEYYSKMLDRLK